MVNFLIELSISIKHKQDIVVNQKCTILSWIIQLWNFNRIKIEFIYAVIAFVPERIKNVVITKLFLLCSPTNNRNKCADLIIIRNLLRISSIHRYSINIAIKLIYSN
jgi:hypothetical protein